MFILDIYSQKEDKEIKFNIFKVDKNRNTKLYGDTLSYHLLVREKDVREFLNEISNIKITRKYKDYNNDDVLEITFKSKESYKSALTLLKERSATLYEYDLNADLRYLIEKDIHILTSDPFYPFNEIYLDIETIDDTIVLVSLYSNNLKKVLVLGKKIKSKVPCEFFSTEKELITRLLEILQNNKYNLILGWNVIDFDFRTIIERCKEHKIEFKINNFGFESKSRFVKDFFRESSITTPGTLIIDIITLIRINNIRFKDYKLDTVAKEVLGNGKTTNFKDKEKEIKKLYETDLSRLIEYNFNDSLLAAKIVEKLNLLRLIYEKSVITNTIIRKLNSPIAILDVMYLKRLHKRGYVGNTIHSFTNATKIEGAYVIPPKPGFYKNVLVFDFKSIYPTIIMTFNIDPFTFNKVDGKTIKAPNGAIFSQKVRGILPEIIEKIFKEREKAKKEKNKIKSYTLKIIINSFYGAMGSPKCRFYNPLVAGAITSFGRFFIKLIKMYLEEEGYKVIYGDTDSVFIQVNRYKKGVEKEIEKKANEFLKDYIEENYGVKSYLKLEYEKRFEKFFIASKKRYVGRTSEGEILFTGLEAIRGDWTELAKNFQKEFITQVFEGKGKKEIFEFIKEYIQNLKSGKLDSLLVYKKKITKPLSEYTKTTPPHVKAARQIKGFSGKIVEYVMTKEGPLHYELVSKDTKYDYDHYIEKQLRGAIDDFLNALGWNFEDALSEDKQKTLKSFFGNA